MRTFTCIPREPLVLGQPRSPISSRKAFDLQGNGANVVPHDARSGIEVDAKFVWVVEVGGSNGVRMKLDAAEIRDPGEPRGVVDHQFFRSAARRK